MRGLIICIWAAVLIFGNALALAVSGGSGLASLSDPPQWGAPRGDYQLTCRDIRNDGYTLRARCQKRSGGWRNSSLDTRVCRSQIINDDGYLRCAQGGPGYGGRPGYGGPAGGAWGGIPPGDYRRTCQNVRVDGSRLNASCRRLNGGWRDTSLKDFNRCRDISNIDGNLRCTY